MDSVGTNNKVTRKLTAIFEGQGCLFCVQSDDAASEVQLCRRARTFFRQHSIFQGLVKMSTMEQEIFLETIRVWRTKRTQV